MKNDKVGFIYIYIDTYSMCIYKYIYVDVYICIYVYIYVYIHGVHLAKKQVCA